MSNAEIVATFEMIDESEDDISTERLLAMTADMCGVDVDDVVAALIEEGVAK